MDSHNATVYSGGLIPEFETRIEVGKTGWLPHSGSVGLIHSRNSRKFANPVQYMLRLQIYGLLHVHLTEPIDTIRHDALIFSGTVKMIYL